MSGEGERSVGGHIAILDGWRALSILMVLAGHWLPLGPQIWRLNEAVPAAGMAIFFTLSGFLITQLLLRNDRVVPFLIRRLFRILPLAWTAMLILAIVYPPNQSSLLANLGFIANLPPARLMEGGHHLWSLCVEVQFYLVVAAIVALAGRRGLWILPLLAIAVTGLRMHDGETISIVTWHRVDEILAGATLCLAISRPAIAKVARKLPTWFPLGLGVFLLASAHPDLAWLNYARPYCAAAMIGASIFSAPAFMERVWTSRPAVYVAQISYALYVVHGMLSATWLGGEGLSKSARYALRPLLIGASFALAHLSTFAFERRWIALGKRLAKSSP